MFQVRIVFQFIVNCNIIYYSFHASLEVPDIYSLVTSCVVQYYLVVLLPLPKSDQLILFDLCSFLVPSDMFHLNLSDRLVRTNSTCTYFQKRFMSQDQSALRTAEK